MKLLKKQILKYRLEIIIFILSLIFSFWLMFSTFSYQSGFMQISTKAWSDFASHIPLIRSFSFGSNIPPEYPLFLGPAIKYHFLFYAFVGVLEKIGLRIDYALNIPSAVGFSFLILMIYIFSKYLFKSKAIGLMSIFFFLFNSSLDFFNFFKAHANPSNLFISIIENTNFPSFGPYDGKIISAFWNLNIYTNQRHLAPSFGLSLFLILIILKTYKNPRLTFFLYSLAGFILGATFLLNISVFLMTVCIFISLAILFKEKRKFILIAVIIAGIIALPQYLYIQSSPSIFNLSIYIGYLVENLNPASFINYWVQNLGVNFFLIPFAFLISSIFNRKVLLSFFMLFIIGNLIQFSPEIASNHKFFNFFIIVGGMFSAFLLKFMWGKNLHFKLISVTLFITLILTGIIDFFPIINDSKINLSDYQINKDISWIKNETPANANFLNTDYLYDTASLAGRKIFLGWPYFAWSQGFDTQKRDELRKILLNTSDLKYFCENIIKYNIEFAEINTNSKDAKINYLFFSENFERAYFNKTSAYSIYKLRKVCLNNT